MNGRLMKMELDGDINNKENIEEISEKRLEEIKQKYPNFMKIYTINDYKKIEQLTKCFLLRHIIKNRNISIFCF